MKPRIIIEISGGVCVAVYADQQINYSVLDHDNAEHGDMNTKEKKEYKRLKREAWKLDVQP